MRKRNQIKANLDAFSAKFGTDYSFQFGAIDKLRDGQSAHWDDKTRPQDSDLFIHPRRTIVDFVGSGDAISARRRFPGKASAYGCEIDRRSNLRFVHPAELFEPTKQRFSRGVGEWSLQNRFSYPGCLADEYYVTKDGTAGNGRRLHARAAPASEQAFDVCLQQSLAP